MYTVCNGTTSDTSAAALVNIVGGPQCYCEPTVNYNWGEYGITNVTTTGGVQNINNSSSVDEYTNYSTNTVSGVAGMVINYNITTSDNYTRYAVYVDWNQNGSFYDPGDTVYYMSPSTASPGVNTFSGSFVIPNNATPGHTRMRVRSTDYYDDDTYSSAPCGTTDVGETEDYDFYIIPQTPCSGTPFGTAIASNTYICPSQTTQLNLTNYSYALVVILLTNGKYQIQEQATGSTYLLFCLVHIM